VDIVIASVMSLALIELFSTELTGRLAAWLDVAAVDYTSNLFNNVYLYGVFFYNNWYLPFLAAAVVLLVAMLGSIVLTTRLVVVGSDVKPNRKFSIIGLIFGLVLVGLLVNLMSADADTVLCEPQKVAAPDLEQANKIPSTKSSNSFFLSPQYLHEYAREMQENDPNYGKVGNPRYYFYPLAIGFNVGFAVAAP